MVAAAPRTRILILLCQLFALTCVAFAAPRRSAMGQQPTTLRGTITGRETGLPLVSAIVTIGELGLQQFSNQQGTFYFPKIAPGVYRVNVRQLGYTPSEASATVTESRDNVVNIRLGRIATKLAPMQVLADPECDKPGAPAPMADDPLAEVFEQLEQSAVRLRLFSAKYPFSISTERMTLLQRASGTDSISRIDTTDLQSDSRARYKPGEVLTTVRRRGQQNSVFMRVPTLLEFGDAEFQKNHCFILRGVESVDGSRQIRIDFTPWKKLKTADVDGSAYLDSATFRLLKTEISVTKVPPGIGELTGVTATTNFSDIAEGMPVISGIKAVTTLRPDKKVDPFVRAIGQQVPIAIHFLKDRPDLPPPKNFW